MGSLMKLAQAQSLGIRCLKALRQNVVLSFATKIAMIILASFGYAPLWLAIVADVGAMLIVCMNGMRLLEDVDADAHAQGHSHGHAHGHSHGCCGHHKHPEEPGCKHGHLHGHSHGHSHDTADTEDHHHGHSHDADGNCVGDHGHSHGAANAEGTTTGTLMTLTAIAWGIMGTVTDT